MPARLRPLIAANPFTLIVGAYRRIILDGQPPSAPGLAALYPVTLLVCLAGLWWFGRTKAAFADVL